MKIEVQVKQKEFETAVARKNITYLKLADKLNINRIYLSNIKNGKLTAFKPSGKLREKILKVLGVEFDDIFEIKNHEKE